MKRQFCLLGPLPSPAMFKQGPQTISTDPVPSPFGCQSPSQVDGSRTRKDGFPAALPFDSSLCAGPLEWWPGGEIVGLPDCSHCCSQGATASRHGRLYSWSLRPGAWTGFPLPQKTLWKLKGQKTQELSTILILITKSYYGKSNTFTWACWLCRLRQKQLLSRQQLYHGRVHLWQKERLEKTGNMETNR